MKIKLKKILKDKIVQRVLITLCIMLILIIVIINFYKKTISPLESGVLVSYSNKMVNNIEVIKNNNDKKYENYIIYTMLYYYNELNRNEVSTKEVKKFVLDNFNLKLSDNKINSIGTSLKLLENGIKLVTEDNKYIYTNNQTLADIAKTKVPFYKLEKIQKKNKVTYKIIYQKYIIENPYEVLNYYDKLNNKKKTHNKYDTTDILKYITGKGTVKEFIDSIDENTLDKFSKKKEKITIEYKVINNHLTISTINK